MSSFSRFVRYKLISPLQLQRGPSVLRHESSEEVIGVGGLSEILGDSDSDDPEIQPLSREAITKRKSRSSILLKGMSSNATSSSEGGRDAECGPAPDITSLFRDESMHRGPTYRKSSISRLNPDFTPVGFNAEDMLHRSRSPSAESVHLVDLAENREDVNLNGKSDDTSEFVVPKHENMTGIKRLDTILSLDGAETTDSLVNQDSSLEKKDGSLNIDIEEGSIPGPHWNDV